MKLEDQDINKNLKISLQGGLVDEDHHFMHDTQGQTTQVPLKSELDIDENIDYTKEYQLSVPGSVISGKSIRIDRVPLVQSSINLANSVIGIGNLGFPYLMRNFGVLLTFVFFIFAYWLMYISCKLLLEARKWCGKQDYTTISLRLLGYWGLLAHFAIMFNNCAMCIAFIVVYLNCMEKLLSDGLNIDKSTEFIYNKVIQMVLAAGMVFPFLFIRSTKGMKFASKLTFVSHIAFSISIGYNFYLNVDAEMFKEENKFWWFPHFKEVGYKKAITSFPVIWMAFSFQFNFFPVAQYLQRPSEKRIMQMSNLGLMFPTCFYTLVGFFGYAVYRFDTQSNFLESFEPDQVGQNLYVFTYVSIIMAVVMTYPLYFFEARNTWLFFFDLMLGRRELFNDNNPFQENMETRKDDVLIEPFKPDQYIYILLLFLLTFALAYFLMNLFGTVISINGATAGNLIGLILPAIFYLRCVHEMKCEGKTSENQKVLVVCSYIMIVIGLLSGGLGLIFFEPSSMG